MKKNELKNKLIDLELKEKCLKRKLDLSHFSYDKRTTSFNELKQVQKEIKETKFKLQLLKELDK